MIECIHYIQKKYKFPTLLQLRPGKKLKVHFYMIFFTKVFLLIFNYNRVSTII